MREWGNTDTYDKVARVIDSCKTFDQILVASAMIGRYRKVHNDTARAMELVYRLLKVDKSISDIKRVESK